MDDRPRHPSGRPIRRAETRKLSIWRNPGKGPLLERLREPQPKDAIGFHHMRREPDDDE